MNLFSFNALIDVARGRFDVAVRISTVRAVMINIFQLTMGLRMCQERLLMSSVLLFPRPQSLPCSCSLVVAAEIPTLSLPPIYYQPFLSLWEPRIERSCNLNRHNYLAPNIQPSVIVWAYPTFGFRYGHGDLYISQRRHPFVIVACACEAKDLLTDADLGLSRSGSFWALVLPWVLVLNCPLPKLPCPIPCQEGGNEPVNFLAGQAC